MGRENCCCKKYMQAECAIFIVLGTPGNLQK